MIYTTSPPHSTHLAGFFISKRLRVPWVADFRDPWTLNAYHGQGGLQNLLLIIEKLLEKLVLYNATFVLANTGANLRNLIKAFPDLKTDKVRLVSNGWEEFNEKETHISSEGPLTILHAGTFYPKFRPYALLEAIATWRRGFQPGVIPSLQRDQIKIILLGSKDHKTRDIVKLLGLDDIVEVQPWVDLERARRKMKSVDFLWATLGTGNEASTYIPSKIFEYMAAERPILGFFPEGEASKLIRNTNTGIVFNTDEPTAIISFLNDAIHTKRNGGLIFAPNRQMLGQYHVRKIVGGLSRILDSTLAIRS